MAYPDASRGPAHVMLELMRGEIERESRRVGNTYAPSDRKVSLGNVAPGVLYVRRGYGGGAEHAFHPLMRAVAALPDHAGPDALQKALDEAAKATEATPRPRNDPEWVQVGDTIGSGKGRGVVEMLTLGHSRNSAKNGDHRACLPRAAFLQAHQAECIVIGMRTGTDGWWRYGNQIPLNPRAPEGRRELPHLRRMHRQIARDLADETRALWAGKGSAERFVALLGMRTAALRMLETAVTPAAGPEAENRTHLRQHMIALRRAARALDRPEALSHAPASPLGKAVALVRSERAGCRREYERVSRKFLGERLIRRGDALVAASMTP